jgi:hypothetical protein
MLVLEELHRPFVLLGLLTGVKRSKVPASAGLGVGFS